MLGQPIKHIRISSYEHPFDKPHKFPCSNDFHSNSMRCRMDLLLDIYWISWDERKLLQHNRIDNMKKKIHLYPCVCACHFCRSTEIEFLFTPGWEGETSEFPANEMTSWRDIIFFYRETVTFFQPLFSIFIMHTHTFQSSYSYRL